LSAEGQEREQRLLSTFTIRLRKVLTSLQQSLDNKGSCGTDALDNFDLPQPSPVPKNFQSPVRFDLLQPLALVNMSGAHTTLTTISGTITIIAAETYSSLPTTVVDTIEHLGINPKAIFPLVLTGLIGTLIIIYIFAFVGYILWNRRKQKQKKVPAPKSPHANDIPLQDLTPRNEDATKETNRYKTYLHDFMDSNNIKKMSKKSAVRQRSNSMASSATSPSITLSRSEFGSASAVDVDPNN
jgi:hypothetical protein